MYGIPASVWRSNGLNFVLVGGTACANSTSRVCSDYESIARNDSFFCGSQKLTSAMKLRPEKSRYTSNLMLYTGKSS